MNKAMKSSCIAKICVCAAVCALNAGAADFLVSAYGAKGDGVMDDTAAFNYYSAAVFDIAAHGGLKFTTGFDNYGAAVFNLKSGFRHSSVFDGKRISIRDYQLTH